MPTRREQQLSQESARTEDYLEAIYHLIEDKGYATTMDISEKLRVKPPTVSNMIGKLATRGYLIYEPYKGMRLTELGEKAARSVVRRHQIISEFLSMIGVEGKVAYEDTEGIEHHVQSVTILRLERLVEFLRKHPAYLAEIKDYTTSKQS